MKQSLFSQYFIFFKVQYQYSSCHIERHFLKVVKFSFLRGIKDIYKFHTKRLGRFQQRGLEVIL